jgi:hypothetical protein
MHADELEVVDEIEVSGHTAEVTPTPSEVTSEDLEHPTDEPTVSNDDANSSTEEGQITLF